MVRYDLEYLMTVDAAGINELEENSEKVKEIWLVDPILITD